MDGWRAEGKGARAQQGVEEEKMKVKHSVEGLVGEEQASKNIKTGLYMESSHLPPHLLPSAPHHCQMMQRAISAKRVHSDFL